MEPRPVPINTDQIKLDSFLKWANVVTTGGQAKSLLLAGVVSVNGELEQRRGRKLRVGDIVVVQGVGAFRVIRSGDRQG